MCRVVQECLHVFQLDNRMEEKGATPNVLPFYMTSLDRFAPWE